jgi:DnaJ-class molecular chaperone
MKNYYKILGVKLTDTNDEIKKIYRQLALKFHPDRNPNNKEAEEQFKKIAEAYEMLSDEEKRNAHNIQLQHEEQRIQREQRAKAQQSTYSFNSNVNWGQVVFVFIVLILGVAVISSLVSGNKNNNS